MAALTFAIIAMAAVYQTWASLSSFSPHQMTHVGVWECIRSVFDPR